MTQEPGRSARRNSVLVMEKFTVRRITSREEFESIVTSLMFKEKWIVPSNSGASFFASDPSGHYVGELNGKPICCVALLKYDNDFALIGYFIVSKEYRGQGYGKKIFDWALDSAEALSNIGLMSLESLEHMYAKTGFRRQWIANLYELDLAVAAKALGEITEKPLLNVRRIDDVDFQDLLQYDTTVFGYSRPGFLSQWLRIQGSHVRVATNNEGCIVGYTVVYPTLTGKFGYKIGPLYADTISIAKMLLKATLDEILEKEKTSTSVVIDILPERNKDSIELVEMLHGQLVHACIFMTRNGPSKGCLEKWFGLASRIAG